MGPALFVGDLAVVLVVAAVTSVGSRRLGLPVVLGYLLAGLIVGPYIPIPIFADAERIEALSQFGVVLVMFSIGLEFSVRRLVRVLPVSGLTAAVQIGTLAAAGFGLARVVGLSATEGLFLGSALAISSTMVVAKVFAEHPPEPRVRELVYGVLIVQDLVAIILIALLTAVAAGTGMSPGALGTTVANLALVLVGLLLAGLLVVPRLVRIVARFGSPELLLLTAAAVCFGLATLAQALGYSVALGAFLGGMLVAEAGRVHDIEDLVRPLRDLFAAIFFVSVGMSVDPRIALDHLGLTAVVAVVVVVGQFVSVSLAGVLSGNGVRRSVTAGLSLGQIGEFSFIIAGIGATAGVVGTLLRPVVVSVAVVTAFTTPMLVRASGRIAAAVDRVLPHPVQTVVSMSESWWDRLRRGRASKAGRSRLRKIGAVLGFDGAAITAIWVVIAIWHADLGTWLEATLGVSHRAAASVVMLGGVALCVPFVVGILRAAKAAGHLLADWALPPAEAGMADLADAPRRAFVVASQIVVVLAVGVPVVALTAPLAPGPWGLLVLALVTVVLGVHFWRSATNLQGHVRATSTALVESLVRHPAEEEAVFEAREVLPGLGISLAVEIPGESRAAGRTLAEVNLRVKTGATVVAIQRGAETIAVPSGSERFEAADKLVLAGTEDAVLAARDLLEQEAPHEDTLG